MQYGVPAGSADDFLWVGPAFDNFTALCRERVPVNKYDYLGECDPEYVLFTGDGHDLGFQRIESVLRTRLPVLRSLKPLAIPDLTVDNEGWLTYLPPGQVGGIGAAKVATYVLTDEQTSESFYEEWAEDGFQPYYKRPGPKHDEL